MRFYTTQHQYYCGIDLHARTMYVCILNRDGEIMVHRNIKASPEALRKILAPSRNDLVMAVECVFTWYWLADFCGQEGIPFVLGHALYMKAIHGGQTKHDKIDAHKVAVLLRGGMLPQAYAYPAEMRATRDLWRRRRHLMRKRAELLAHIQNTNRQYHLPEIGKQLAYKANRTGVAEHVPELSVRQTVEVDLRLINESDELLRELALYIVSTAKHHDVHTFSRLRSIPGIGKILALVLLYEIHDINRFPRVQEFVSYARLVKCPRESAGKRSGTGGHKIGNVHLKWAFSEAAVLFLRKNPLGQTYLTKLARQHGNAKALSILAPQLGRAVYFRLKRHEAFAMHKFLTA
jgi:transposase